QVACRDRVARGRPPVAGDDHPAGKRQRDDGGAVRSLQRRRVTELPACRQQVRRLCPQELGERRRGHAQIGRRQRPGLRLIHASYCPPFCTYARTKSSAFSSRTSSISSRIVSTSSPTSSRRPCPAEPPSPHVSRPGSWSSSSQC